MKQKTKIRLYGLMGTISIMGTLYVSSKIIPIPDWMITNIFGLAIILAIAIGYCYWIYIPWLATIDPESFLE